MHFDNQPVAETMNNNVLMGIKAMPMKSGFSDGTAAFSCDRRHYADTYSTNTLQQNLRKKWQGGSRDASEIVAKRRVASMGASLNPTGSSFAFNSNTEQNSRHDALTRCRGGGASVPNKVRVSPSTTGVPSSNGPLISRKNTMPRSANRAILANHAPWATINT